MILQKVDSESYKDSFINKFTNFADKAPIVVSFATDDLGVSVVHENSGKKYFYPWDYVIPVKSFIHDIKRDLEANHYPRISRKITIERPLTAEEQANMIAGGMPINEVPSTITEDIVETYRIDKIIVMRDEFILVNEETNEQFCYRMSSSAFSYLRTYRSGGFKDLFEAGDEFFKKAALVIKLNKPAEEMMGYRRSSSDKQWQDVKKIVKDRDNNSCRLCRCLNIKEFLMLRKNAGSMLGTLDPAHIKPVSEFPDLCYDPNDICLVNHYSHSLLDSFKDPIDGHHISKDEVDRWWIRIAKTNKEQYKYLLDNNIIEEN